MSTGFRKSLFGFNCNDVIDYIEKTHKKFKQRADALTQKTEELSKKLDESKIEYEKLLEEKNEISQKLDAFTAKADEIERLSENIGKLYLVSQANAQAIVSNAEQNKELAKTEVERNLSTIDEAHASLNALRESIIKTSDDFIKEVDLLLNSLNTTKEQINENTKKSEEAIENFEAVYESIVSE